MLVGDFMVPKASLPPSSSSLSSGSIGSIMSSNEKTTTSRRLSKGSIELAAYNGGGDALRPSQPPSATKKRKREGESASGALFDYICSWIYYGRISLASCGGVQEETWKVDGKGVGEQTFNGILVNLSRRIKLVVSLVCYSLSGSPSSSDNLSNEGRLEAFRVSLLYAVPALLYTIDNNLIFVILEFLDPAEMAVMWNFKIVPCSTLSRIFSSIAQPYGWSSAPPFLWRLFVAVDEAGHGARRHRDGQDICGNRTNVTTGGGRLAAGDAPPHLQLPPQLPKGILLVMVGTTITSLVYTGGAQTPKSVNFSSKTA